MTRNDFKNLYVLTGGIEMTDKLCDFRYMCRAEANRYERGHMMKLSVYGIEFIKDKSNGYWTTLSEDTIGNHFIERIITSK